MHLKRLIHSRTGLLSINAHLKTNASSKKIHSLLQFCQNVFGKMPL